MRLQQEIVALLRVLDTGGEAGAAPETLPAVPRVVFDLQLASRLDSGALQLTRTGARALFQAECIEALEETVAGAQPAMAGGVERWLTASGFMHATEKSVTARGKLWLASLTPEQASRRSA